MQTFLDLQCLVDNLVDYFRVQTNLENLENLENFVWGQLFWFSADINWG